MAGERSGRARDAYVFLVLACALTWALDAGFALHALRGHAPPPWALSLAGLGAWGPTLAAVLVARFAPGGRAPGAVRAVFRPFLGAPAWVALGLVSFPLLHQVANVLELALGGRPAQWLYPPAQPEHVAALVMFSFGEEFGWRGFAYPRLVERHGPVLGNLLLGAVWGLWHLLMMVTVERGAPSALEVGRGVLDLALSSLVLAWLFERGGRRMAVAVAVHASAHLDNVGRAPPTEVRLQVLRLAVTAVAAGLAARALARDAAKAPRPQG